MRGAPACRQTLARGCVCAGNTSLSGAIPDVVPSGSKLQALALTDNLLTGSIPASLGNAAQLTAVDLSDNALTGTIPAAVGDITTLRHAIFSYNLLTGESSLLRNRNITLVLR